MSINQKPEHLQISSYFKEEYKTTNELKELDLYYTFRNDLRIDVYIKLKSGVMKKKIVHISKKDTQFITHRNNNYTLSTILNNALTGTPLEKGIDKAYSPKKIERRAKATSWFSKLIWWLRGGK